MFMTIPINKLNGTGIKRVVNAARCSFKGFRDAWRYESAFRQELTLAVLVLPISFVIAQSSLHWLALVFAVLFVLFAEVFNSALEAICDAVTLEHHPLIGRAKDMGSAAVFIAMCFFLLTWGQALYLYYRMQYS
jgi:diacylglycerol kinase (ATP)